MKPRRILGMLVAASLLVVGWVSTSAVLAQARERSMYVSVVDQSGAPVANLGVADFIVREDNVSREVLRVVPATEPMQVALLVDNSSAATEYIPDIRRALPAFVEGLIKPVDTTQTRPNQVAIIGLGERPTILSDYTSDSGRLGKVVERVWQLPASANYLLDALVEVTRGYKVREAARPVIVAITAAGGPEFSTHRYEEVLDALRASNAPFYLVTIGTASTDASMAARSRDVVLGEGPTLTGGTRDDLLTSTALNGKLQQLANVLTHQYKVTYAHPDSLIPPDRVTVSARRPNLKARGALLVESTQGRP